MADEINVSVSLNVSKGFKLTKNPDGLTITMTGTRRSGSIQDIGNATHELLEIQSDFGTPGFGYFKNLDATSSYVEIGTVSGGTFYPFGKFFKGEFALIPLTTKAVYAKASAGTIQLEYEMVER